MLKTAYLGQFEEDNAEAIAERLEAAGIVWYHKQAGRWTQRLFLGEWGVRLYAEEARLDEARAIAAEVTTPG
ncbi:MAG TPA: hypothetical protein VGA69_00035 [Nitriliruptorales bacterium]